MGLIAFIIFSIILIYGSLKGCGSSNTGVKTYRRKSGVLSGRR